jgi:hypothetical protein
MAADSAGTPTGGSQPPGSPAKSYTPEQQAFMAALDKVLAEQKYNELGAKMLHPGNSAELAAAMDWGRDRMLRGSSVAVPLIQSTLLWSVGSTRPDLASLKETSGFVLMYAVLVASADGLKCADVSAQGHGIESIIFQYGARLREVAAFPEDTKNKMIDQAVAVEAKTAPLRKDDSYLCRFGMAEYAAAIKRQEDEKAGRPIDQKAYQPAFLQRDQWEPKQTEARKGFRNLLVTIFTPQPAQKPKP